MSYDSSFATLISINASTVIDLPARALQWQADQLRESSSRYTSSKSSSGVDILLFRSMASVIICLASFIL
jgi:hypothetical protein